MTSFRQIEANRRNALRSTGPRSRSGKHRARANALRHGLTGETVITMLEDAEEYQAFEAKLISDYDPRTVLERELVVRLASLARRLRRATAVETGLCRYRRRPRKTGPAIACRRRREIQLIRAIICSSSRLRRRAPRRV
jgi:hypothetical protein